MGLHHKKQKNVCVPKTIKTLVITTRSLTRLNAIPSSALNIAVGKRDQRTTNAFVEGLAPSYCSFRFSDHYRRFRSLSLCDHDNVA